MNRLILLVTTILFLSACTSITPETEIHTPISTTSAVIDLLDVAHTHTRFGEYAQAKSTLERALRMDPQNAYVWFELAKVNKEQGANTQAKNLALRAQSFTKSPELQTIITRFMTTLE